MKIYGVVITYIYENDDSEVEVENFETEAEAKEALKHNYKFIIDSIDPDMEHLEEEESYLNEDNFNIEIKSDNPYSGGNTVIKGEIVVKELKSKANAHIR